ncbi:RNA polymerase sigma factor [Actinoplanes ianthinogenes]|uniref:RNA polymerase sigma factor n=2 Tax=Actinoplanes ianthinogenes TaxID=122358 RepID=A0ABN6C4P2_9ACTN|nr:RNA polymerase sigma factor [Actinoplanes ianthinogenes]
MTEAVDEFSVSTGPFRRELLAHCYRMLGSVDEAEDVVQETYLRAWKSFGGFEGRSSVRVWLYRIATNVCLTAIRQRGRRAVVEPIPDEIVTPEAADPATVVAGRESLRLALIVGLQCLPPRQRAVLILREVLGFPAGEVADMLDTTVAAVKSSLQRARARLEATVPRPEAWCEPDDPRARELLDQYVAGFERADIAALERALRTDAAIELAGTGTWFSGREACLRFLTGVIGSPGDWRMIPTVANGQPAAAAYRDGKAFGLGVLTVSGAGIARILVFDGGADLVGRFGLPPTVDG